MHITKAMPKNAKLKETHISWVFLTGKHAYKIKKPVNFGFLDFTTLEKRKYYCDMELKLNRRLCKDIYLEVVPVTQSDAGLKIGGTGEVVDYAVKMKQLPEGRLMSLLLKKNKVNESHIAKISKIVASFHKRADAKSARKYGSWKIRKFNWDENFQQTQEFIGKSIHKEQFDFIQKKVYRFFQNNKKLFEKRIKNKKIRDCHGDLHSGNIFISDKIYIFDAIEFNERFRYVDVASEVAFMSMDLDFHGRSDLANHFVNEYIRYSRDEGLLKLLNFYKCYMAYVRGKVIGFMRNDDAYKTARKYFDLSEQYAKLIVAEPSIIVTCGLSGSGKSWLAREIANYGDFAIIRSDEVRKQLAKAKKTKAAYGKGIYTKEFTEKTYVEMLKQARKEILRGKSVILDATFSRKEHRDLAAALSNVLSAPFVIAYCTAPEKIILKRLRSRRRDVSDANTAVYRRQKKEFALPKGTNVLKIDTTKSAEECANAVLRSL